VRLRSPLADVQSALKFPGYDRRDRHRGRGLWLHGVAQVAGQGPGRRPARPPPARQGAPAQAAPRRIRRDCRLCCAAAQIGKVKKPKNRRGLPGDERAEIKTAVRMDNLLRSS
jgi:hypothetical protein